MAAKNVPSEPPRDTGLPVARARAIIRSHSWLRHALLAVAWVLLWRVSVLMQITPQASIWFPPAGLTFAALLLMGWRAVPVLMACAIATSFIGGSGTLDFEHWRTTLLAGTLFGAAHCFAYGCGAAILRRVARRSTTVSLPAIIILFLVTGCLSALGAALLGVHALLQAGRIDPSAIHAMWLPWWVGDMTGALVLTPLFLGLSTQDLTRILPSLRGLDFRTPPDSRGGYALKLLLSISLLSIVMLLCAHFGNPLISYGVFFLILPQMWIVYTETPFRSALSLAVFSTALAVWVAALGLIGQALVFQFAICVIAASAYFGLSVPVLVASNRQLSERASRDDLTQVASKNHFFERSEQVLADARRDQRPVALVLLDVDHFKDINDGLGHVVGDQALVQLALAVGTQLRTTDVFGRFGGDEFMLLLPGSDHAQAQAMAERLRRLLQETAIPGTRRSLAASFGVVDIAPDESIMQAFKRADRLLLEVKTSGRNRIGTEPVEGMAGGA